MTIILTESRSSKAKKKNQTNMIEEEELIVPSLTNIVLTPYKYNILIKLSRVKITYFDITI